MKFLNHLTLLFAFTTTFGQQSTKPVVEFKHEMVPEPVLTNDKEFVDFYYKAWEIAFSQIKTDKGVPQSPYVDEAFDPNVIWIWDTNFMLHFWKYAQTSFPESILTLNNFYKPILDKAPLSLSIEILDNPPLFSWTENAFYKLSNNKQHLEDVLVKNQYPQRYFEYFDTVPKGTKAYGSATTWIKKVPNGYLWEGGRSGMDNTPRGRIGAHATKQRPNNPDMLWVDAISQQALNALYIKKMYEKVGDKTSAIVWNKKYEDLKSTINLKYWNEKDQFYYDLDQNTLQPMKVKSIASYWPLLAEVASNDQAKLMVDKIKTDSLFGGQVPLTTLARNDSDFKENGEYWRGGVWLPTAYMTIKGLEKYGYYDVAYDTSYKIISHMLKTYNQYEPHTIWESYSPTKPEPAANELKGISRPNFCGWSALGPISLLIEDVIGFYDIDAAQNTIKWNLSRKDIHGIKNLKFGTTLTDIIYTGNNNITVKSTAPYLLFVNGKKLKVKTGDNNFKL